MRNSEEMQPCNQLRVLLREGLKMWHLAKGRDPATAADVEVSMEHVCSVLKARAWPDVCGPFTQLHPSSSREHLSFHHPHCGPTLDPKSRCSCSRPMAPSQSGSSCKGPGRGHEVSNSTQAHGYVELRNVLKGLLGQMPPGWRQGVHQTLLNPKYPSQSEVNEDRE